MVESFVRTERAALADDLLAAGPDSPTLCEGWLTRDLAAHVVARERRPDAALGIVLPALRSWRERVRNGIAARPYDQVVTAIRNGPPSASPLGVPAIERAVNTAEFFIHHEDVRRARPDWEPRPLPAAVQQLLWRTLVRSARWSLRVAPCGVVLRRPDGTSFVAKRADTVVTVTGEPAELVLFASGRQDHARVVVEGDPTASAALQVAALGG